MRKIKDLTPQDPDFVTSLERGIRILGVFDRQHPELLLGEVAQRAKLSPATARRFLMTLKALGYIGKNGRRYLLRSKVLDIGYAYINSMGIEKALQPYLLEFAQQTGECTSVTVLEGTEIVFVASYSHGRSARLSAATGSRFPAYVTAAGRVLLAHLSPAHLAAYFKETKLRKFTDATETDPAVIERSFEGIRANGYSLLPDQFEFGLVMLGVPIFGSNRNVIASITCASITHRTYDPEIIHKLQDCAGKISGALERFPSLEHSVLSLEAPDDDAPFDAESVDDDADQSDRLARTDSAKQLPS